MTSIWKSGICGAVGGLAGALAMHQFRIIWESRAGAGPDNGIFGFDEEADVNAVDGLWNRLCLPALSREEAMQMALLLHYAFGVFSGSAYGVLAEAFPASKAGSGLLFGSLLWLVGDEMAVALTGLSNPLAKTASSHVSALFAHLLFGIVTEFSRKGVLKASKF